MTRFSMILAELCETLDARLTALEDAKPQAPSINGLRRALLPADPAPCTGTGSGGCDCLPDDEA